MSIRLEVVETPYFMDGPIKRYAGDVYTEENETQAKQYIELGWCKNAETGEVGERKPGAQKLQPNSVKTPIK